MTSDSSQRHVREVDSSLLSTPVGERVHIGFFGVRNAGKSSVVNAVTGQDLAIVSNTPGTTTDPVRKAMELLPLGPVLVIDTPGIDDEGELGSLRVKKARRVVDSADIAVLVVDGARGLACADEKLIGMFEKRRVPYVVVMNKCDITNDLPGRAQLFADDVPAHATIAVSAITGAGIRELKELIATLASGKREERRVVADLIDCGDDIVLVTPIDSSAPKGRLILPQQMTIRDILDAGAHVHVARETELLGLLDSLVRPPRLVITDSQAFAQVASIVSPRVPLTSFSILMARYKGDLALQVAGADELDELTSESRVLLSEGCTHHRQCKDIGTVKLPAWIQSYAQADIDFAFTSGTQFPEDVSQYQLVVHCGGCMLTEREMHWRLRHAAAQGVPCTNYGVAIAKMNGILARALQPLEGAY